MSKLSNLKRKIYTNPDSNNYAFVYHRRFNRNNSVALDLTMQCNASCFNCEASCRQAPSNEKMTLEQIKKFVDEAIKLKYRWDAIKLRGGEPTLHPEFSDILKIIKKYKDFHPDCKITIVTNGMGKKVNEILSKVPDWVCEQNSSKKTGQYDYGTFKSYNIAPKDLFWYKFYRDYSKGCNRLVRCHGLALSRYGYYPCTHGANVDRVFGFDIGIKKLSDVNEKALRKQMQTLCKYCGHFKLTNDYIDGEKMSKSWQKIYKKYKQKKPDMSLY